MLDEIDQSLVALEERPDDRHVLEGVFRGLHTIKGTCGFLGFERLEKVAHAGETLLRLMRDGKLELSERVTGNVFGGNVKGIPAMSGSVEPEASPGATLNRVGFDAGGHRLVASLRDRQLVS